MTFVRFANYLLRAASMNHVLEMWKIFIDEVTVGERRRVSEARVASLHFPVLRYYTLFAGRCLIGCRESRGLSAPDHAIVRHALLHDRTFSLGAMVARRLSLNRSRGLIFGVIYASRLARRFKLPIRHDEE